MSDKRILDAVLYAQAAHCEQAHGSQMQVDVSCPTCLALHRVVQVAEQAAAPVPPRRSP